MDTDSVRGAGGAAMARRAAPALVALAIVAIGRAAAVASDMPLLQAAVAPSAAAQGGAGAGVGTREAYLITDLGNTFPVDVAPPNMTRIMLGLLDDHENVTRSHVEHIRMYVDERDIRINATFTNMAEAILNATNVIRDADADMAESERERMLAESRKSVMASVAAFTAQIHFVNYDEPAKIVVHRGTAHTIGEFKPSTTLPGDAHKFIIYDDSSWLLPDRHIILSIHSKAYASAGGNASLSAMPGGWMTIYAGHPYSGPASLWSFGCNCPSGYLQHPLPSSSTKTICMPSDYSYEVYLHKVHSDMAQPPAGLTWQELGTPCRAAETGFHRFAFDTFSVPDPDFDAGANAYAAACHTFKAVRPTHAMLTVGDDERAKYPFLADSGDYLRDKGFTLEQFGKDPDLEVFVKRALERVMAAASGRVYKSELDSGSARTDAALPLEVFSFLLAVVLLRLSGMDTLVRRFALAEARRAEAHLERDLGGGAAGASDPAKTALAVRLIDDLFSVAVSEAGGGFAISVADYVRHAVKFHEVEWKLVNRRVAGGLVRLTRHEVVRLVRSELVVHIRDKVRAAPVPDMLPSFEGPVAELVEAARRLEPARPQESAGELPPCIKHAMGVLERGENLPHSGRFMLATFFINRGWPVDRIAPMFKNAPDYNERITMYQLRHLSGEASSAGTRYSCPSCKKLRGQDLCFPVPACERIYSPMQFLGEPAPDAPA